jgi:membrane protease YdiL (CAAX protease family)
VAALAGIGGMTAIDGVIQLVAGRLILPPVALHDPAILIGNFFALVVVSPLLETVVMAAFLEALVKLRIPDCVAAIISATAWSAWHGYVNHPAQAPSILWIFWVLSILYLNLRRSAGVMRTSATAMLAHAMSNFLGFFLVLAKVWLLA